MTITFKQVVEAAQELVDEYGEDFVYKTPTYEYERVDGSREEREPVNCMYSTQDGQPSCLVGHVAHRLHPELFKALREDEWGHREPFSMSVSDVQYLFEDAGFEENAIYFLYHAQTMQDNGIPWSDAVREAEELV